MACHTIFFKPEDMFRTFVFPKSSTSPISNFFIAGARLALLALQERPNHFNIALMLDTDYYSTLNGWVFDQAVFNLERVDILASSDDQIFESTSDGAIPVRVEHSLVSRMQP